MKITQSHYTFWLEHKAPTPTWAAAFDQNRAKVSVHELINVQAGKSDHVLHNALQLVKLRRSNGDPAYWALEPSAWDKSNIPRRYFMLKRWRQKLIKSLEGQEIQTSRGPGIDKILLFRVPAAGA